MRSHILAAARDVVQHLDPAEASLAQALISNAELMACLGRARASLNMSVAFGHETIEALAEANSAIVTGISKTIAVHRALAVIRDRLGMPATAVGGATWKGDEDSAVMPAGATLSVVPSVAAKECVAA